MKEISTNVINFNELNSNLEKGGEIEGVIKLLIDDNPKNKNKNDSIYSLITIFVNMIINHQISMNKVRNLLIMNR